MYFFFNEEVPSVWCFDINFHTAESVFKNRLSIVVVALLPQKGWLIFEHKFLSLVCINRYFHTAEYVIKNRQLIVVVALLSQK